MNYWALPAPFDVAVWCLARVGQLLWWMAVTPTRNVADLGPGWVVAYWGAVAASLMVGGWGSSAVRQVRKGSDFLEFNPEARGGGAWVGKVVTVIRFQVAAEAWVAGTALVVGYSAFLALMVVGILWRWLPIVVIGFLWSRWRAATRTPWWTGGDDLVD